MESCLLPDEQSFSVRSALTSIKAFMFGTAKITSESCSVPAHKIWCGLLLITTDSTLLAAFGLVPDAQHCGRSPADRKLTELWFLQHIHVCTVPLTMDIDGAVWSILPEYPFAWCTRVYSVHVPLLTWVLQLVFLCYLLIEWILCASPGCHLPSFQTSTGWTFGWRKGWGRDPTTVFDIYLFIFSSFSPKRCWHLPWVASLYFNLSWSPLTVTDLFPAYTGISAQLQGKNLNFNEIPTKSLIAVGNMIMVPMSSYLDPFREEVLFTTNKDEAWQTAFKSKHKP